MRKILIKILVNALAIWVATAIVPGVNVGGDTFGRKAVTLLVVGTLFGVVNTVIKPIVKLFAFPFYILTLGLMAFVVNALMLMLSGWLSRQLGIAFEVGSFFWSALGAAVVVTVVSMVLHVVIPDGD